jgi:cytochrome c peroxidase
VSVPRNVINSVGEPPPSDLGRYEVTQVPDDRWRYKTPILRNIALTAPYMHNGAFGTLKEVVDFYNRGGVPNPLLDPLIRPLGLTDSEIRQIVAFLGSLTGDNVKTLVRDAFAAPIGDRR